jgi:flagellar assembly factor FliW
MPITLTNTRFGDAVIPEEHTLEFPEGIIGIPSRHWAVLTVSDGPFRWLQSLDDASMALPVCDPRVFFPEVAIELAEYDRERAGITEQSEIFVWTTVRAMDGGWVTNLRAPIIVVDCKGWQLVNHAPDAPLRAPLSI